MPFKAREVLLQLYIIINDSMTNFLVTLPCASSYTRHCFYKLLFQPPTKHGNAAQNASWQTRTRKNIQNNQKNHPETTTRHRRSRPKKPTHKLRRKPRSSHGCSRRCGAPHPSEPRPSFQGGHGGRCSKPQQENLFGEENNALFLGKWCLFLRKIVFFP